VLLAGFVVTAALSLTAQLLYDHNENRLLSLHARELGVVLSTAVAADETPLASGAALADATNGNPAKFRAFMASYVGPRSQFASVGLWSLASGAPVPGASVGAAPPVPPHARAFFGRRSRTTPLSVTGLLGGVPRPSLEFAVTGARFAAYGYRPLPADRRSRLSANSAFSELNYALYLGRRPRPANLLLTNLAHTPATGRRASYATPYGDAYLELVVTPRTSLGGAFFEILPWLVAAVGVVLTLAAALLTERLVRRRQAAERLAVALDAAAEENRRLYGEQHTIAQALQHALLPDAVPQTRRLHASARYVPGTSGIEVGGDWYDVIPSADGGAMILVGDVSGHGLHAAATMGSLRFAALAYAAVDRDPAAILAKLSSLAHGQAHDYFATVLCACVDLEAGELTVASAGHPAPLLISPDGAEYVAVEAGPPAGAVEDPAYVDVTVTLPPRGALVAFTDGLVERRGEPLDVGLARLRAAAAAPFADVDSLVARLLDELARDGAEDDIALVAVSWGMGSASPTAGAAAADPAAR
jgi:serine phosphatase RsbU (regulator of sigma subunit)